MTNLKKNKYLLSFLVFVGFVLGCSATVEDQGYRNIDAVQAAALIKQGPVLTASKILISKGFHDLYHMKGGIKDWIKHELPVEKSP